MKTRKSLEKKATRLWGQAVHQRDEERCQVCGSSPAQAHHLVGRRNYRLRFEPDNGILLCPKHHTFDSKFSAHQTPTIFGEWFESKYPERHQFIRENVNEIWDKDYDKVLRKLESQMDHLRD
jgi:hypothetical protein